jgi:AcrR family transcriptional regulator
VGGTRGKSKAAIEDAAARLFAAGGYASTSVREIARVAGADPALVIRHFGSKEQLFLHTMQVAPEDMLVLEPPLETLGERIVRFVVTADDRLRSIYLALVRASDSGQVGSALSAAHEEGFVRPLREVLTGEDRDLRARLVASMVGGLMYALWIVEDDVLASADRESLAQAYVPALQQIITPHPTTSAP